MERRRTKSASPFEEQAGFARAIRVGERILVAGTAPIEPDGTSTVGDAAVQARRCFAIIVKAIEELGGAREDVVRTRMFITDAADYSLIKEAHRDAFGTAPPVATMVVTGLLRPEWKVEIEAEAIVAGGSDR